MDFLMAAPQTSPMMSFLPLLLIMFAVMYFLIIRPQKTKEKKRLELISNVDRKSTRLNSSH